jgi:hypothetical protein
VIGFELITYREARYSIKIFHGNIDMSCPRDTVNDGGGDLTSSSMA